VQFYDVVVWLHVSSVVIAFGATFAFGIYLALAARKHPRAIPDAGTRRETRADTRQHLKMKPRAQRHSREAGASRTGVIHRNAQRADTP
jgi:hypothetical protein